MSDVYDDELSGLKGQTSFSGCFSKYSRALFFSAMIYSVCEVVSFCISHQFNCCAGH